MPVNPILARLNLRDSRQTQGDDVQCSHGASVGQLDPQAIFYLRSRGLDERKARQLLCLGFASEVIERFECEALRDQLTATIRRLVMA